MLNKSHSFGDFYSIKKVHTRRSVWWLLSRNTRKRFTEKKSLWPPFRLQTRCSLKLTSRNVTLPKKDEVENHLRSSSHRQSSTGRSHSSVRNATFWLWVTQILSFTWCTITTGRNWDRSTDQRSGTVASATMRSPFLTKNLYYIISSPLTERFRQSLIQKKCQAKESEAFSFATTRTERDKNEEQNQSKISTGQHMEKKSKTMIYQCPKCSTKTGCCSTLLLYLALYHFRKTLKQYFTKKSRRKL